MSGRLSDITAVITGSARGLGRACALAFAREGADLTLVDVPGRLPGVPYPLGSESQLRHTADLCRTAGAAVLVRQADVRDLTALESVVADATGRFGAVDVLVNNAGIAAPSGKAAHDIDVAVRGSFHGVLHTGNAVDTQFADFFRINSDDTFYRRDTFFFAPLI